VVGAGRDGIDIVQNCSEVRSELGLFVADSRIESGPDLPVGVVAPALETAVTQERAGVGGAEAQSNGLGVAVLRAAVAVFGVAVVALLVAFPDGSVATSSRFAFDASVTRLGICVVALLFTGVNGGVTALGRLAAAEALVRFDRVAIVALLDPLLQHGVSALCGLAVIAAGIGIVAVRVVALLEA
jgi:hypothetical protein